MGALLARPVPVVDVEALVIRLYLETGNDVTVKQIAEHLDCSETTIRKRLDESRRLRWDREAMPTYSRNYPAVRHGTRLVTVYGPTRDTLRQLLNQGLAA